MIDGVVLNRGQFVKSGLRWISLGRDEHLSDMKGTNVTYTRGAASQANSPTLAPQRTFIVDDLEFSEWVYAP
jgi:hypothetical protein